VADQWLYSIGGKKAGPTSFGQLQEMVQSGQLKPTDLVQRDGTRNWVAALTVEGLVHGLVTEPVQAAPSSKVKKSETDLLKIATNVFQKAQAKRDADIEAIVKSSQDPILAAIASLLLPPLGQLLLGQKTKALGLFILFPLLVLMFASINSAILPGVFLVPIFLPAYCLAMSADAFLLAKKVKDGSEIGKWEFFAKWSPY